MGSCWVEIPQHDDLPILVDLCQGLNEHFSSEFRFAVGAHGEAHVLFSAVVLVAIDCGS